MPNDLHLTDLFNAAAWVAIVYVVFNAVISFRSGRPLVESVNQHRHYLLPFAGTLVVVAAALTHRASLKYHADVPELLEKLVREEKAPAEVIGAVSCVLFALALVLVYVWCRQFLPRDPRTFAQDAYRPHDEYRRAMRHYIRWSRQLDYVVIFEVSAAGVTKLAQESLGHKPLFRRLQKVDPMRIAGDATDARAEAEKQKARWDDRALAIIKQWGEFDKLLVPARQGENVHIFFDVEYGGVFVERLKGYRTEDGTEVQVYLFAACVDEHGISTATAASYFRKMCDAIKYIRGGSTAHYK